jgi:Protein of unknown function (DUF4239)
MLNNIENILMSLLAVVASLLFMAGLNKLWPWEKRHEHNDLIGWQLGILGTTYAVILGFMLYTVWTNYIGAEQNVDLEATSLRNIYRLGEGLPEPQRAQMQSLCRSYATTVIEQDWPMMARNEIPLQSHEINNAMWKTLMSIRATTPTETIAEDHALFELSQLTEHRHTRLLESAYRIPVVLWSVLLIGGVVTVTSASMFGSANLRLHALQVLFFSLLVSLVLLAIADINRPFQGAVHVTTYAFERAQQTMTD